MWVFYVSWSEGLANCHEIFASRESAEKWQLGLKRKYGIGSSITEMPVRTDAYPDFIFSELN